MRLLLDEHFSPEAAESLRRRGHDVVAIAEREDLRGRDDIEIVVAAAAEERVVVTENARDFVPIGSRRLPSRKPHHGVVLVPRRYPRLSDRLGPLIRALDALLAAHPGDDDLVGEVIWLQRTAADPD